MTWSEILDLSAAALNDTAREKFTNPVLIPYLNMSLIELQEIFELNDIPVTEDTSAIITVPSGSPAIGYNTTPPLPSNLIEIKNLWESTSGLSSYTPMYKVGAFKPYNNVPVNSFGFYIWNSQEIRVLPALGAIDLKIDYVKALFNPVTISLINAQNTIRNTDGYIWARSASFAAFFIDENTTRSAELNNDAAASLSRSLGISIKGMQAIVTRRRPFRASFKARRSLL